MTAPEVGGLLDFTGSRVLVTGASRGLGRAIAMRFAEAGADLAVGFASDRQAADDTVAAIREIGRAAVAVGGDLTDAEDVGRIVEQASVALGPVNVAVNNAGSYPLHGLLEMSQEAWSDVIALNLRGVHLCTQAVARQMSEGGAIVNVASIEALAPAPMHAHYCAAKAGVVMYTRSAALELAARGVRVNAVSPGLIWRDGIERDWPDGVERYQKTAPMGRLGQPHEVADACLFLASPGARWITGANLVVDGGVLATSAF